MPAPSLRTPVRVRFADGTIFEVDRDPDVAVGELIPPSLVGAFWARHHKLLVKDKTVTPATDIEPGEIRYHVESLTGGPSGPCEELQQ